MNVRAVRAARKSLPIVRGAFNIWMERNAFQHAAALAFYTLFSLAPLVIIIVAIVGIVLGDDAARGQVSAGIKDFVGAQAALAVEDAVRSSRMKDGGLVPTIVGIGMLLFGATTMFAQMQTSLNDFWGVVARPSRSGLAVFLTTRLLSLGVVLVIGFLLLTSLIISMSIVALINWASAWIPIAPVVAAAVDLVLSWAVATALFATIFKMLPDVKLQWRDMWKAGAATAALFVVGKYVNLVVPHHDGAGVHLRRRRLAGRLDPLGVLLRAHRPVRGGAVEDADAAPRRGSGAEDHGGPDCVPGVRRHDRAKPP